MHPDRPQLSRTPRNLAIETQGHALIGLKPERQGVGIELIFGREENVGSALELDADLAGAEGQILASPNVEGHTMPAPVIHKEAHRQEGLDMRVGLHLGLTAVGRT